MLFADDAAVAAHSPSHLQSLMDRFANASTDFGFTISLKLNKTLSINHHIAKNHNQQLRI